MDGMDDMVRLIVNAYALGAEEAREALQDDLERAYESGVADEIALQRRRDEYAEQVADERLREQDELDALVPGHRDVP